LTLTKKNNKNVVNKTKEIPMKNMKLLSILYIASVFTCFIQAQSFNFAPLKLGNIWVYEHQSGLLIRGEVVDSSFVIDSIKYFGLAEGYFGNDRALRFTGENYFVMKEDSSFPEPLNERIYYKKNAQLGDTWQVNYGLPVPAIYTITDTFPAYVFDTLVTGKLLNENFGLVEWDYIWTEEFGQLSQLNWLGELQYYLKGCVINGRVYGDTTFIVSSIDDITSFLSYELFQNYPNPFNSSTILTYTIPEGDYVLLEVYNSLGEKVDILVNDFIPAGKHSVMFVADKLTSGVYIYSLRTSSFRKTKKMLLLK
jgi:hypothetical protein